MKNIGFVNIYKTFTPSHFGFVNKIETTKLVFGNKTIYVKRLSLEDLKQKMDLNITCILFDIFKNENVLIRTSDFLNAEDIDFVEFAVINDGNTNLFKEVGCARIYRIALPFVGCEYDIVNDFKSEQNVTCVQTVSKQDYLIYYN